MLFQFLGILLVIIIFGNFSVDSPKDGRVFTLMLKITVPHSSMNCWCLRLLLLFTVALSVSVNSSSSQCSIKVLLSHLVPVFLVQIFLFFFLSCRRKHWLKKPHGARHLQGPRGETRCLVVLPYRHSLGFNFKIRKILDVKKINKKETSLGNSCLLYPLVDWWDCCQGNDISAFTFGGGK